jgi:hypothetical protein
MTGSTCIFIGASILAASPTSLISDEALLAIEAVDLYSNDQWGHYRKPEPRTCWLLELDGDPKRRVFAHGPPSGFDTWVNVSTRFGMLTASVDLTGLRRNTKTFRVVAKRDFTVRYGTHVPELAPLPRTHPMARFYLPFLAGAAARDLSEWMPKTRGHTLTLRIIPPRRWASYLSGFVVGKVNLWVNLYIDWVDQQLDAFNDYLVDNEIDEPPIVVDHTRPPPPDLVRRLLPHIPGAFSVDEKGSYFPDNPLRPAQEHRSSAAAFQRAFGDFLSRATWTVTFRVPRRVPALKTRTSR